MAALKPCPCQSGLAYEACCGVYHRGFTHGVTAPTAESLMRSRYSAFALGLLDYIKATWAAEDCPEDLSLEADLKWIRLKVLEVRQDGDRAIVHFKATARTSRGALVHEERSLFTRRDGVWLYQHALD